MAPRSLCAVALVACLLIAGCGGGGSTATPATSPGTAATTTPTPTAAGATIDEAVFPPGAAADGIGNVSKLLAAHRAVVGETDYVVRYRRFDNRAGYVNVSYTARSSVDSRRALYRVSLTDRVDGELRTVLVTRYDENGTSYRRTESGSNVTYATGTLPPFEDVHASLGTGVEEVLVDGNYTAVGTTESNNWTYVRYRLVGFDSPANVTTIGGTVLVREDGLIAAVSVEVVTGPTRFEVVQRYVSLGDITVVEPAWVGNATG